jgi:hypothetical protein
MDFHTFLTATAASMIYRCEEKKFNDVSVPLPPPLPSMISSFATTGAFEINLDGI